jgi:hypothetical protein
MTYICLIIQVITPRFLGFESFSPQTDIILGDKELVKFGEIALKTMHNPVIITMHF